MAGLSVNNNWNESRRKWLLPVLRTVPGFDQQTEKNDSSSQDLNPAPSENKLEE
jgi:hypothetical protein